MEKLFYYFITGWILVAAIKIFINWLMQKAFTTKTPEKRNKLMNSRTEYTSKLFNQLLKSKKLDYPTINSISQILSKYAGNKKYENSVHKIYSVLKYQPIRNQDLAQIQFLLDCAKCKKAR